MAVLRRRRAELRVHEGRPQADRRARRARARAGLLPHAQPADHRRRHAGAQVGLHQRLHAKTRRGSPIYDWTILDRIFDTYLAARRAAVRRRSGSCRRRSRPSPSRISTTGRPTAKYDEIFTGWAYPPKDYAKWGELVLPVGEALRRAVRPRRGRAVVLGGLERAEHRLLARHAGGVPQAARLRGGRRAARVADGARGRPGRRRRAAAQFTRDFFEHCCAARTTRPAAVGTPTRLRLVPRQRERRRSSTATCAWASPTSSARSTTASASSRRSPS